MLLKLVEEKKIDGVMGMGGLQNTVMCSAALRLLPIGFPKIICSTIASGYRYFDTVVGDKDIMVVIRPIVDFAGMNPVNEAVLGNTVSALIGMVTYGGNTDRYTWGKNISPTTLMGITNDTVMRASDRADGARQEDDQLPFDRNRRPGDGVDDPRGRYFSRYGSLTRTR
ncbi:MAG: Tm-1-like ATP-binding domain-containing protein [Clostridium fessum]